MEVLEEVNVGTVAFIGSEIVLNKHFLFCNELVPDNNRRLLYVLCVCAHMHTHAVETGEKLV